jgi:hypothetical protein
MRRRVIVSIGLLVLALGGVFLILPVSDCEEMNAQEKKLTELAGQGDLHAVSALFALSRQRQVPALEEVWALEGALLGDPGFQKEYVIFFKTRFDRTRQERVIKYLQEKRDKPGAKCLTSLLTGVPPQPATCPSS